MSRIFIIFDTETTGLDKKPLDALKAPAAIFSRGSEVCQIGGLIVNEQMGVQKLFCHYCDTVVADSHPGALAVHGISMRDVRSYIPGQFLAEVMMRYLPEFFQEDVIFIGYNAEFDMSMVAQTLSNSPVTFTWKRFKGTVLPRHGRFSVDVAEYFKSGSYYKKLHSFESELAGRRKDLLFRLSGTMSIETNCIDMLSRSWEKEHNAFFDAVNTYLLWGDKVWKKKLI